MYPVLYKVHYWDEDSQEEIFHFGVTLADSYSDAMEKVETYYGDNIISVSLFMEEECSVYEFNLDDKYLEEYLQQATAN